MFEIDCNPICMKYINVLNVNVPIMQSSENNFVWIKSNCTPIDGFSAFVNSISYKMQ